jgi:LEA14-like dessication related protein
MRTLRLALASLAVLALASCAEIAKVAKVAVQEPRITFRTASLDSLDLEGATIALEWSVENPNGFGLDLASLGYRLDLEGKRIVDGTLPGGLQIPANGAAPLKLPVHVRFADVPGFAALLSKKEDVGYRLSGTVGVRTPLGVLELPVSHDDRLPLPRLPAFALDGLSVRSTSFTEVAVEVKLRVKNPNRFPLPAPTLSYGVSIAGGPIASAETRGAAPVAGSSSSVVAIPVRISLLGAGRAAAAIVQGGPVDVALTGSASFGGIPVPLDLHARLRAAP